MALALNNPQRLICYWTKKAKLNQPLRTTQGQFLRGNFQFGIQRFSSSRPVARPMLKSPVCPTGGRFIGFILLPKVLMLWEMQTASFRIWTRVAMFTFYENNHDTIYIYIYIYIKRERERERERERWVRRLDQSKNALMFSNRIF